MNSRVMYNPLSTYRLCHADRKRLRLLIPDGETGIAFPSGKCLAMAAEAIIKQAVILLMRLKQGLRQFPHGMDIIAVREFDGKSHLLFPRTVGFRQA